MSSENISEILGSVKTSSKSRKKLYIAAAVIVLAGFFFFSSSDKDKNVQYETADITRDNLTSTVTATGNLKPLNQVEIGSEISGLVREVKVDFNDLVTKEQTIAVLDTDQLEATLAKTKATLELSEAELMEAEANYKEYSKKLVRAEKLAKQKNVSQQYLETAQAEYTKAKAGVAKAKAKVNQAKADLSSAKKNLEKAYIKSPVNGIVLSREVEPGQTVAASLQAPVLFILAEDLSRMQLYVNIDEADIGQVRKGQKAIFTVDAYPQDKFNAEIVSVRNSPVSEQDIVTYEAVLNVDNSEKLLKPGMTATAEIITGNIQDALIIPNSGLRFSPPAKQKKGKGVFSMFRHRPRHEKEKKKTLAKNQKKIWLLKDNEPKAVVVETGLGDGNKTQIISENVKEGDKIITSISMEKSK